MPCRAEARPGQTESAVGLASESSCFCFLQRRTCVGWIQSCLQNSLRVTLLFLASSALASMSSFSLLENVRRFLGIDRLEGMMRNVLAFSCCFCCLLLIVVSGHLARSPTVPCYVGGYIYSELCILCFKLKHIWRVQSTEDYGILP